jgi:hypothetical protein
MNALAPIPSNDPETLQSAISDIDCLAQTGFSEISAIAKLALASMEVPDSYRNPETIAQALRIIVGKAGDSEASISREAEDVGCNYQNHSAFLRSAAHEQFISGVTVGGAA